MSILIQSMPSRLVYFRFVLILSSHVHLGFHVSSFLHVSLLKLPMHLSSLCMIGYIKNAQNPTRHLQSPTIFNLLLEELIMTKKVK
jgi:hypothetical protein